MADVVLNQSGDTDGMAICTVCYQDQITEKSFEDVAISLHKEAILQEFKSLSDGWKMFQGITIFRKYLGEKTVFRIEEPPQLCSMCLIKMVNLVEAIYVITHTQRSGAEKMEMIRKASSEKTNQSTKETSKSEKDCPTVEVKSSRPKRSVGRSLVDRNPDFLINIKSSKTDKNTNVILNQELEADGGFDETQSPPDPINSPTIKQPLGSQSSNSTVRPNIPVAKFPNFQTTETGKTESMKYAKTRNRSPAEGLKSPEKKVKIMLPQEKTESLGSKERVSCDGKGEAQNGLKLKAKAKATLEKPRCDTNTETPSKPSKPVIKDQRNATSQPFTQIVKSSALEELPKWKTRDFRSTYLNLLEEAISCKGLKQQLGSANDMEKKVFEHSQTEDMYIQKMAKLLKYCNGAVNKTKETEMNKSRIEEQNEAKKRSEINTENCETGFVPAADPKMDKMNKIIEEVATGKCGFLETPKNIAHLMKNERASIVNENPKSTSVRAEFSKKSLNKNKKTGFSSIATSGSQANTTDVKRKSRVKSRKKTGKPKNRNVFSSKLLLDSKGFCAEPPDGGNSGSEKDDFLV